MFRRGSISQIRPTLASLDQYNRAISSHTQVNMYGVKRQQSNTPRNKKGRHPIAKKRCRILTDDFAAFVKQSQTFRFKVHRPGCACGKVKRVVWPADCAPRMDNFWVLKDTPSVDQIFCGGSAASYETDPLACEVTLRDVVFTYNPSTRENTETNQQQPPLPFKISCALCMLTGDHPNGFVCITADTAEAVNRARDMAWHERTAKLQRGEALHSDHAHFVCTLSKAALQSYRQSRTHKQALMDELMDQGLKRLTTDTKLELGHHLKAILGELEHEFLLVMVYDDKTSFALDVPGGKRQLGEGSWECAVRETSEETSLLVESSWVTGRQHADECNIFYMAHPPVQQDEEGTESITASLAALTVGATKDES